MARPARLNVSYRPVLCQDGPVMSYVQEIYGNNGYAAVTKLLNLLGATDNHFLDLNNPMIIMISSKRAGIKPDLLIEIIADLSIYGYFDTELWNENRIVWCPSLVEDIQAAYLKRKNVCITKQDLLFLLNSLGVRKLCLHPKRGGSNPQTKLNETKLNETKLNKSLLSEIDISDVPKDLKIYFDLAKKFQKLFIKNLQNLNTPTKNQTEAKFKAYTDPIRKLIEIDQATPAQLDKIHDFIDSPKGDFWKNIILSTTALRRSFQMLSTATNSKQKTPGNYSRNKPTLDNHGEDFPSNR